jgi:peptidoglycan/xylan/chitin deacetylase (PgdA/CDA1 family)
MNPSLTVVLPLRAVAGKGGSDLDRFERLLWPSFGAHWRDPDRTRWLIVCPDGDVDIIETRLVRMGATQVEVVSEDLVLPGLRGRQGWFKQQLLKLAASNLVATSHYLTLDADVMLMRPASIEDLMPEGRPRLGTRRASDHLDWWQASGRVLKSPVTIRPEDRVMGVTPAILQTALARRVLPEIARRNAADDAAEWLYERRKEGWTEYTLYWLLALETGVASEWLGDDCTLYKGIFTREDLPRLSRRWIKEEFEHATGAFFLVMQSTLGLGPKRVERLVRDRFRSTDRGVQDRKTGFMGTSIGESLRGWIYERLHARRVPIGFRPGVVSISFDDFPASAMTGARLLEERGWFGTFYVAPGMLGQEWVGERICNREELEALAARGHEVANHTHTHLRCYGRSQTALDDEFERSRAALEDLQGNRSFAYPHGAYDTVAARYFGKRFETARTVEFGVNRGKVDLNRLRATTMKRDQDFAKLQRQIDDVRDHGGWLILVAHDVSPEPSPYGCTPERFRQTLDAVAAAGLEVARVTDVYARLSGRSIPVRPSSRPAAALSDSASIRSTYDAAATRLE